LPLAKPLTQLQEPRLGYVMELLAGLTPLTELIRPGQTLKPLQWYLQGGGLRRRLRVLARLAATLAELHGRGLVYGDLSPNNVMVSISVDAEQIYLIDVDNLRYRSTPATSVHTPRYGAPELVCGRSGCDTLTDAHAFAVLAFEVLTATHPLLGDWVEEGEPELEEQAFRGELPWIDDPDDDRNRSSRGLPREVVLSPGLQKMFQRSFGWGLRDPLQRPGMAAWTEVLRVAAEATLRCGECGATWYRPVVTCLRCGKPQDAWALGLFHLYDPGTHEMDRIPDQRPRAVSSIALAQGEIVTISRRLAFGVGGKDAEIPVLTMRLEDRRVIVQCDDGNRFRLIREGSQEQVIGSKPVALYPTAVRQDVLHFGENDRLHRTLRFEWREGGRRTK
jgi:serine/threonine protein kinase